MPGWRWKLLAGVAAAAIGLGVLLSLGGPAGGPAENAATAAPQPAPDTFPTVMLPFLQKYCMDCHSGDGAEAGLDLAAFRSTQDVLENRKRWEKVFDMLDFEAMPPGDADPLPTSEERRVVLQWLEQRLFQLDCRIVRDPGRVTVRRLNRAEYNNTIRDLLGVDFHPADDFPSDDVGYGFDNIGDVLSVSPLLLEKYLDAAEQIAQRVIVDVRPQRVAYAGGKLQGRNASLVASRGTWAMASVGAVFARHDFPKTGRYRIRVEAAADQAGSEPARVKLTLDGRPLKTFDTEGQRRPGWYEIEVRVDAGAHRVAAEFINDYYNPSAPNPRDRDRNLYVRAIEIVGPLDIDPATLPEPHRRIVTCRPSDGMPLQKCAERILRPLAYRAFRRPVRDDEVQRLVELVETAVAHGESFEGGLRMALQAILVSPHFLFRIEQGIPGDDPAAPRELTDFELASRLSYFIWSSMPDEELFRLAEQGRLRDPDILKAQVKRMLADPRARALADQFAAQWLNLGMLDEANPDPKLFPEFDAALKRDMRAETLRFFETVMREDRSILEFLDGRFTFVNERLARLYGIDGVRGEQLRRVSLEKLPRAGLLTQPAILTLTSNPGRTSPVKRGKWILENLLGTPPPDPPANVPQLEATRKANPEASLREQLQIHRADPACAACHQRMDELGFGLENFDPIGRWRDRDGKHPIDATGELPGGIRFNGPLELVDVLKQRSERFARCLTEKMLTFALGRGLEFYDRCTVDQIVRKLTDGEYRFSVLVTEIVLSEPFRKRRPAVSTAGGADAAGQGAAGDRKTAGP